MIRVAIVEDETLVRLGLRMCLESSPDIYVAGAFASAEEAEAGQDKAPADVLLTDIRLPGSSGLELMRRLRKKYPQMLFVVLSCYDDFTYAQRAMEYGASRYILKHELDEKELPRILLELVQESRSAVSQEPEPAEDIPGLRRAAVRGARGCASNLFLLPGGGRAVERDRKRTQPRPCLRNHPHGAGKSPARLLLHRPERRADRADPRGGWRAAAGLLPRDQRKYPALHGQKLLRRRFRRLFGRGAASSPLCTGKGACAGRVFS